MVRFQYQEGGGILKTEVVEKVLNRMADKLDPEQLQELKSALVISLEGYQVTREETQLSTEVYDNWDLC